MSEQTDRLISTLSPFGLSEEEAAIYLLLLDKGDSSALKISREIHIARTKVYRLLDKLISKQLVIQKLDDAGFKFQAANPESIRQLVLQKEVEVKSLRQELPFVLSQLHSISPKGKEKSKVLYYTGKEGLAQVTYNSLRTKGILRTIEVSSGMDYFLDEEYSEKLRGMFLENKIHTRQLSNIKEFKNWTKLTEFVKYCELRYIPPQQLKPTFETLIYNNVYVLYQCVGEEIFCVEIYNEHLATMQKQIHDFLWEHAQKMKYTSPYGAAKLVR